MPTIEPLAAIAWARIERGVWDRLAAPSARATEPARRWRWIVGPLLAVPAVAAIVALGPTTAGGDTQRGDARLVSGSSPTTLSFGDTHVTVEPDSELVMNRDAAAPRAVLERGAAWLAIAPRIDRSGFVAAAGAVAVHTVDARFRIAREDGEVTVEVARGRVEIEYAGHRVVVGPDHRWTSSRPAEIEPRTEPSADGAAVAPPRLGERRA